jgi:uncharacterized protein
MVLTAGEKLIALLLCQFFMKKEDRWIDPAFVQDAISTGHTWAIEHKYPAISDSEETASEDVVSEVIQVLSMFNILEASYENLSAADRKRVDQNGIGFRWQGFYGNQESHRWVAEFMITKLDRFTNFRDRSFESNHPMLEVYQRMLAVFAVALEVQAGELFSADQIIAVINERIHPERRSSE